MQLRTVFSRLTALSVFLGLLISTAVQASFKDLPYPQKGELTGKQIAEQVYYVNHFLAFRNFSIVRDKPLITVLFSRDRDENPVISTVERHLNNEYDGAIQAKDLAVFRYGRLRGTGILITDYTDDERSQTYQIWLPSLRKVRRFSQPAHDDAWGGTDFTFGDVVLRKPKDEDHRVMSKEVFSECLKSMDMKGRKTRFLPNPPKPSCDAKGREVYVLRSTTKFKNWWYDYRVSYVDTKTFADYRTVYFKDNKQVKLIDRDWRSSGEPDPRAQIWGYWYGLTQSTGHETWAVIPKEVVRINRDVDAKFWSERHLRRLKRR